LKWSAQIPAEPSPSANTISKKSESAVVDSAKASSSPSGPVFEKHAEKGSRSYFSKTIFLECSF